MQKGSNLKFCCPICENNVYFSLFELGGNPQVTCNSCQKCFSFQNQDLLGQLNRFEALCHQIHESQDILGSASIGINIEGHQVKIPYKLLLTRFNSHLELQVGDQPITITFRLEPLEEFSFPKEQKKQ